MSQGKERGNNGKASISSLKNRIRELERALESEQQENQRLEKRMATLKKGVFEGEVPDKPKEKKQKNTSPLKPSSAKCPKCDSTAIEFEIESPSKTIKWRKCTVCPFKERIKDV